MKLINLAKLGHRHLVSRKKQSFLSICSTALLFGVLLGIVFLLEGMKQSFVSISNKVDGKPVYLVADTCNNGNRCVDWAGIESLTKKKLQNSEGEIVGELKEYRSDQASLNVVDEKFVENLTEVNLAEYPEGTLFKLVTLEQAETLASHDGSEELNTFSTMRQKVYSPEEIDDLRSKVLGKEFTETYYIEVGDEEVESLLEDQSAAHSEIEALLGETSLEEVAEGEGDIENGEGVTTVENQPESPAPTSLREPRTLKYVVAGIVGSAPTPPVLSTGYTDVRILDLMLNEMDGSTVTPNLFISSPKNKSAYDSSLNAEDFKVFSSPIIQFNSAKSAAEFYSAENCALEQNSANCADFTLFELAGNRVEAKEALMKIYRAFGYDEMAILLIAISISVFTFVRLIEENVQSIALYRSLGASTLDVVTIHFFYLLELSFLTAVLSVIIAVGMAVFVSIKDATALSSIFSSMFAAKQSLGIILGIGPEALKVFLSILLTAPICSILSVDQFSSKNIAKKLKKS
ncbi:ABC transporter permease [Candidatus Saccharibacteria bacterium]|nr:ABC transporter permease [Candidatus Saccharibacteria bacterium]